MDRSKGAGLGVLSEAKSRDSGPPEPGRSARAGLSRGARATGPRVREVSRAAEEPRGGIVPQRPAGMKRTIPSKRGPRTRGKKESLSRLKNIRALAEAGAAALEPLAASARRAPLPPSGRGGGAPGLGALGRAGLRRAPSWSSPPPPGGLCRRGPKAGGAGPGRAPGRGGRGAPGRGSSRLARQLGLRCTASPHTPSFSFRAPPHPPPPPVCPYLLLPPPPLLPPPRGSSFGLSLSHPLSLALLFDSPPVKKRSQLKAAQLAGPSLCPISSPPPGPIRENKTRLGEADCLSASLPLSPPTPFCPSPLLSLSPPPHPPSRKMSESRNGSIYPEDSGEGTWVSARALQRACTRSPPALAHPDRAGCTDPSPLAGQARPFAPGTLT